MNPFFWNIILAFAWIALTGAFTAANFVTGFLVGYVVLLVAQPLTGPVNYVRKVWQVVSFVVFFVKELVIANVRIAIEVLTPRHTMTPGVVAIPLEDLTAAEITLLSNTITLTPGTLGLDVSDDRRNLYIHAMYVDDADTVRRDIKDGFERRVMEVMR